MNDQPDLNVFDEATPEGEVVHKKPPPPSKPTEEDYFGPDSDVVVLHEQPAIAVYENHIGTVIIRQKADWDENNDTFVFVRPENLEKLIAALQRYVP